MATRIFFLLFVSSLSHGLIAQNEFVVQLAAYDRMVSDGYFNKLPDVDIAYYKDHHNIYHYFLKPKHESETAAQAELASAKEKYPNAIVLDLTTLKSCAVCCNVEGNKVFEGSMRKVPVAVTTYTPPPPPPPVMARKDPPLPPPSPAVPVGAVEKECSRPVFRPRGQEDFERIRTVYNYNPGATIYLRACAPKGLPCYLSLRNAAFCGMPTYTRQELKSILGCEQVKSCVYILDANGKVLDVAQEFRNIVAKMQ